MVSDGELRATDIVILTGAGVSADSGVPTFRAADGLWEGSRVEDVATPEAFARDSELVHAFYDARRAKLDSVEPNAAHRALAELEQRWRGDFLLVTQNVDDLHERAGSKRLIHMHGELQRGWCLACDGRFPWAGPMGEGASCPACQVAGHVRIAMGRGPGAVAVVAQVDRHHPPRRGKPAADHAPVPGRTDGGSDRPEAADPRSDRAAGEGRW